MYNAKWSIFYTLKWSIMKLNQLHTCIIHTNVSFSLELTRWYPAIQFIAVQRTNICTKVLQRFVYSEEWCTFFKGRKMNHCCLCVCFATMRLLFNMSIVFLQRCTIIARPISLNLPCFATSIYIYPVKASLIQTTIQQYSFIAW